MILIKTAPTILRITDINQQDFDRLKKVLSYKKKEVQFELYKMKKNKFYMMSKMGEEEYNRALDRLKQNIDGTVLFEDSEGYYTLPGVLTKIKNLFQDVQYVDKVQYPEFKLVPWDKMPTKTPRYYQDESMKALIKNPYSHIELATGGGKSTIVINLAKEAGLPAVISTPSASIAKQIYKEMKHLFGKNMVGLFGDGKRELGKHFLVAVGKSLSMVEDPEEIEAFKKYRVLISDESHTLGAATFSSFCLGLLAHCEYRWFVSATQERNDGRDILLEGIIGDCVYEKTIQELQNEGFLAKLDTLIFKVKSNARYKAKSNARYSGSNVLKMNQHHIYHNKAIINIISDLYRQAMENNMPVLILIDEKEQAELLKNKIGDVFAFACGGSDTDSIVEDFNSGKIMCVVGTSAVSVGTDFRRNKLTINWKGNKAGTTVKQGAIGRSTRIDEATGKFECKIVDFMVTNVETIERHALERISYYEQVGSVDYYEV